MKLIYAPEGGQPQRFEYDPGTSLSVEAEAIESVGGEVWDSYLQFGNKLGIGNVRAMRALLWVMLRRTNPDLEFDSVSYRLNEFHVDFEDVEGDEPVGKDELGGSDTDSPSPQPASEPSTNS